MQGKTWPQTQPIDDLFMLDEHLQPDSLIFVATDVRDRLLTGKNDQLRSGGFAFDETLMSFPCHRHRNRSDRVGPGRNWLAIC